MQSRHSRYPKLINKTLLGPRVFLKHNITFDDWQKEDYDIFGQPIFSLNNFLLSPKSLDTPAEDRKHVEVNEAFFFDPYNNSAYFHLIFDMLAEYESILLRNPAVQLVVRIPEKNIINIDMAQKVKDMLDKYGVTESNIFFDDSRTSLKIKKLFFSTTEFSQILASAVYVDWDRSMDYHAFLMERCSEMSVSLKQRFMPKSKQKRKIFISRLGSQQTNEDFVLLARKVFDGLPLSRDESLNIKKRPKEVIDENIARYVSDKDMKVIEDFFASHGYDIVHVENMTVSEQAEIFSNASHVAGISGTGIINTIFCDPGTTVFIINTCDIYDFPHGIISRAAGNIVHEVMDREYPKHNRSFSGRMVVNYIKERLLDYL